MKIEDILNKGNPDKIYSDNKYFPGHLLYDDEFYYHIVIGVKGDGKSFWKLINMIKIWKRGMHTVELIQTKDKIKELMRFQDYFDRLYAPGEENDNLDPTGEITNEEIHEFLNGLEYRDSSIWKDGAVVVKFVPLLGMDKNKDLVGAKTEWIVEDETFKDRYEKNTAYAFMLVIDTIFRKRTDIKVTQLGNAISLNHPMFVAMGLYELSDDIITIHKGEQTNNLLCKVWNWKRPLDEIEKSYSGSPLWDLYKETGYGDFAFKNEFKNDNLDNLISWVVMKQKEKYLSYLHTFKIQDIYVNVYSISRDNNSEGKLLYYYRATKEKKDIAKVKYALMQDDANDKIKFAPEMTEQIAQRLQNNSMYYDSVVTKKMLWETVKNRF